jgi:hypothetical protein
MPTGAFDMTSSKHPPPTPPHPFRRAEPLVPQGSEKLYLKVGQIQINSAQRGGFVARHGNVG